MIQKINSIFQRLHQQQPGEGPGHLPHLLRPALHPCPGALSGQLDHGPGQHGGLSSQEWLADCLAVPKVPVVHSQVYVPSRCQQEDHAAHYHPHDGGQGRGKTFNSESLH